MPQFAIGFIEILEKFLPFSFLDSMIMFFFYSFIGWIVEVCYYGVTEGKFINRGFLGGPMCPVYGLGFYGVLWLFIPFINNFPVLFFGSALVATSVELMAGVILYWIFHLRWWDYSDYKFNFHGFICVRFSIYWGIACSLGMFILHPVITGIISLMNRTVEIITVLTLSTMLIVDIIISICCIFEFNQKLSIIAKMAQQTHIVSDKLGEQIYGTVDTIISKTTPAVNTTQNSISEFRYLYACNRKEEKDLIMIHREQEKRLAEEHRLKEKELLGTFVSTGKDSIVKTKDAATSKILSTVSVIRKPDIELIKRIKVGKGDTNSDMINFLKTHFDDNYDIVKEEITREKK